jgi:hypothetical protein
LYDEEPFRPGGEPDPAMPERDQVADRELHRGGLVRGDERRLDVVQVPVHEHHRQLALHQCPVARVVGAGVGVQPGDEDDPGDAALEQHFDVLVLGNAGRCLGTQHRRVTALGQGGLDDLCERREDRVGQLRHHQPDQAGRAAAQPCGALEAEHVECGEHGLPGVLGDAGPAVQYPGDGRLADPGLTGDVGKSGSRHGPYCSRVASSFPQVTARSCIQDAPVRGRRLDRGPDGVEDDGTPNPRGRLYSDRPARSCR